MIKTINVLFYLRRDKRYLSGKVPLYCRITANKERVCLTLNRQIDPSKWDAFKECVKGSNNDAVVINEFIKQVRHKIHDAHSKLLFQQENFTVKEIKDLVLGKADSKCKYLVQVFEEHNQKLKALSGATYTLGTYKKYVSTLKHIQDFILYKYHSSDLKLEDVNHEFIAELDFFLRSKKGCNNNTSVKYLKNLSKIINHALNNSWISKNPLANYKLKHEKVDRGFLTNEELDLLMGKVFTIKRLDQVRDVFIFQCFTGLAYCDTHQLTLQNILKDNNGNLWLKTARMKTHVVVNIPLLPKAIEIIDKYRSSDDVPSNKLLPTPSNQKLNAYLKEIADITGITKRLSSHLARHTFATTITLANGISLESVSKMLGHSNLVTTKIYARMLDSRVFTEMQMLKDKFNRT